MKSNIFLKFRVKSGKKSALYCACTRQAIRGGNATDPGRDPAKGPFYRDHTKAFSGRGCRSVIIPGKEESLK
jgi:hypothetical protein